MTTTTKDCGCGGRGLAGRPARDIVADLFTRAGVKRAARHRLTICLSATECGRPCEHFIKGPGKAQVHCIGTGSPVELYPALERPDFTCPQGRF